MFESRAAGQHPPSSGRRYWWPKLRGSVMVIGLGALPGAGVDIPAAELAIPGDIITATGVLYLKGVPAGPMVFIENGQIVYAVFLVFFLANLMLLPFGCEGIT